MPPLLQLEGGGPSGHLSGNSNPQHTNKLKLQTCSSDAGSLNLEANRCEAAYDGRRSSNSVDADTSAWTHKQVGVDTNHPETQVKVHSKSHHGVPTAAADGTTSVVSAESSTHATPDQAGPPHPQDQHTPTAVDEHTGKAQRKFSPGPQTREVATQTPHQWMQKHTIPFKGGQQHHAVRPTTHARKSLDATLVRSRVDDDECGMGLGGSDDAADDESGVSHNQGDEGSLHNQGDKPSLHNQGDEGSLHNQGDEPSLHHQGDEGSLQDKGDEGTPPGDISACIHTTPTHPGCSMPSHTDDYDTPKPTHTSAAHAASAVTTALTHTIADPQAKPVCTLSRVSGTELFEGY